MDINFSTENLIVTIYPPFAGGKFINKALALHPMILLQHEKFAKMKMSGEQDIDSSFQQVLKVLEAKKKRITHIEYDDNLLANFHQNHLDSDITADEKLSNQLWRELTNQKKFYFIMTSHYDGKPFRRYTNRKSLKLINFEWLVDQRLDEPLRTRTWPEKISDLNKAYGGLYDQSMNNLPNPHPFDVSAIKSDGSFTNEIYKVLEWLGLSAPNDKELFDLNLERLRKAFLETYRIGFPW